MYRLLVIIAIAGIFFSACSGQKKTGSSKKAINEVPANAAIDSSTYNDDYIITNMSKEIEGRWIITKMYRQQNSMAENLNNVSLSFADTSFAGKAPCNSIAGACYINGMKIKFTNIISTKMACDKLEQETAYLKLLQNAVTNFYIKDDKLLLKDAGDNIVFEGVKE